MRLDKSNERELARRKGLATRTIIQSIWLLISGVIGYFLLRSLFDAEFVTYDMFYLNFSIPRSIPEWAILGVLILFTVIVMQFFLILGYAFFSPAGRERPGTPSPYSTNPDSFQDDYRR